ncbi:hypothetical protein HN873_038447, partial [Arachis hypogaea]
MAPIKNTQFKSMFNDITKRIKNLESVIHVLHQKIDLIMAQQKTSTNSSSMLDPTVVMHSSESTKTSDLTGIMPIQPKKLFHLDITREASTLPNGQPHVRVGAVLPK